MSNPHYRRCWSCGAINLHSDNIAPEVCCKRCRSQDTRLMKNEPPLWAGTKGGQKGLYVPDNIGKCPECSMSLIATCYEWQADNGRPVATGIELTCISHISEEGRDKRECHRNEQSMWQPVRDAVVKWCDARVDFPGR